MTQEDGRDDRVVELARAGDPAALETLWRQHRRWVAAIVLVHRPRSIEVEDLMQDVAVKLVAKLESLRDPGAFRPWLRRIVINCCRGAARRRHAMLRLGDEAVEEHGVPSSVATETGPGPASLVERSDSAGCLLKQALGLPPEYREPLLLRALHSLSYREIADILELPVTTIETRLARARKMLREELQLTLATDETA